MLLALLEGRRVAWAPLGSTLFIGMLLGLRIYCGSTTTPSATPTLSSITCTPSPTAQRKYEQALAHFDKATRMDPVQQSLSGKP
jgi:hypothetical protein